jgi:2-methylcitrate dehydratase PrpD
MGWKNWTPMTPDPTRAIAEFVATTPGESIPALARENAVRTVLDTCATAIAGAHQPATRVVWESLRDWAASGQSRLVCDRGARVDPPTAALVNGVAAHCLDYDAISFAVSGFIGSSTVSSLTALVDEAPTDYLASDVLTAYCLGWEGAAAIGRGVNPAHYAKGWHPTATLSGIASALASARLLGLDTDATAMAIGVAVSEASGVKTMIGNMTNAFHVGKAARNGVVAARLAAGGFRSHPAALEARQGFLNLFNGAGNYDADVITGSLGTRWDLCDPGPVFKIYPCCGLIHTVIEIIGDLRRRHVFEAADITGVEVFVHEYVPAVMHVDLPQDGYAAKFSIPYCVAGALRDGGVTLATFAHVDRELVDLGRKVKVTVHPDLRSGDVFFEKEFSEVRIDTVRGSHHGRLERMGNTGTGSIETDTLAAKMIDCCTYGGRRPSAQLVSRLLGRLDGPGIWTLW